MTATTRRPYPKEHASRHEVVMLKDDLYTLLDRLLELHPRTWITNEIHLRFLKYHPLPPTIIDYNHVRPIDEDALFVWFAQDGHEPRVERQLFGSDRLPHWQLTCMSHLILKISLCRTQDDVAIKGLEHPVSSPGMIRIQGNYWDELPLGKTLHRKVASIVRGMSSNDLRTYIPATRQEFRSRDIRATPAAIAWQQAAPNRVLSCVFGSIITVPR